LKYKYIDFIDTASAGYRKGVFLENGGFDTSLQQCEDVDLSFRLAQRGYKLVFSPQAIVYHRHPESLYSYLRRKYAYGYWRVFIYERYPQKMTADSRTPQAQRIQTGLSFLLAAVLAAEILLRESWLLAVVLAIAVLFFTSTLPFCIRAVKKDLRVGLISPIFLFLRALAVGLGLSTGLICQMRKRLSNHEILGS